MRKYPLLRPIAVTIAGVEEISAQRPYFAHLWGWAAYLHSLLTNASQECTARRDTRAQLTLLHPTISPKDTPANRAGALKEALARLAMLRSFKGPVAQFWLLYLQTVLPLASADEACLIARTPPGESGAGRQTIALWPPQAPQLIRFQARPNDWARICDEAEKRGACTVAMADGVFAALALEGDEPGAPSLLVLHLEPAADAAEAVTRLRLLAGAPLTFQLARSLELARSDMERFAVTLDLLTLLNNQTRSQAAAMQFCNEIAARFSCDRVSLGWHRRGYVRLQAISHTEHFEKKMALAGALEAVMDEAYDQDEELLWPPLESSSAVVRDHGSFARAQSVNCLLTLPLRLGGEPLGALLLERAKPEFTSREVETLRLLCDQSTRRLQDLREHDRWFGLRALSAIRSRAAKLLGPEHTGPKLLALGALAGALALCLVKTDYRIEAPFVIRTDALAQIPAPFDGFIDEVSFRAGDPVTAGQTLLKLDTRDLLLEEAAELAEEQRFVAEAQKAESAGDIAAMTIAQASAAETRARLALARHHLDKAEVAAPFAGYIVEGDLRERISAPVKQGEVLVKVARIEAMFAEVALAERDVQDIAPGETGEIAFASRPHAPFPVRVERVAPTAEVKEKGNVFIVRALPTSEPAAWWRPGMSGVCKVTAGRRSLLWIWTHRTVDYLRLKLWW